MEVVQEEVSGLVVDLELEVVRELVSEEVVLVQAEE